MVDRVEDAQGLGPGPAGGTAVARAAVHAAEVVERVCLVVPVGELPAEAEGPLVAGDRLLVVAELVVDVAEAVPGGGLPVALSGCLAAGQGPLAVGDGQLIVTAQRVAVASVVQAHHFQGPVARGPGQFQGRSKWLSMWAWRSCCSAIRVRPRCAVTWLLR